MINTSVSVIAVLMGCPVAGPYLYRPATPLTLHNGDRDEGIALFDGIDDLLPIALHPAKNRVLAVQPRSFDMGNEELRAISVWPGVCHTQDARAIMPQGCRSHIDI